MSYVSLLVILILVVAFPFPCVGSRLREFIRTDKYKDRGCLLTTTGVDFQSSLVSRRRCRDWGSYLVTDTAAFFAGR